MIALSSFRYDNEAKWFEVVLKVDYFTSINSAYCINKRTGAIYLSPDMYRMICEVKDQIVITDPVTQCPWVTPDNLYRVTYNFILKSNFFKRDADNCIKKIQDAVFECLHVNDSRIVELHGYKSFKPGDSEYLILRVSESDYDYMQFSR